MRSPISATRPISKCTSRPGPHVWFLILNMREGPFTDQRIRQAANYAIDKESLVTDVLQGTAEVAAGPIARPSPGPTTRIWSPIPTIPTAPALAGRGRL
jgi:ABC-type transport system substrate-binding protein